MLRPRRRVAVKKFDVKANQWVMAESDTNLTRDALVLATYNIWFSDHHATERYHAIADLLSGHSPDVIVLQEVTPAALDVLLAQPWIRQHYYRVDVTGEDHGRCGLMILSRLPLSRASYTHLPSSVGRGLLQVTSRINGRPLALCSVHLQSGKSASQLRARQIDRVFRSVGTFDDVVLLGDFNMRDMEDAKIPDCYVDAWPTLRPHDHGFTEDTLHNQMLKRSKNKTRQVRFDRVLIKGAQWKPTLIELLGTAPISEASPEVFPSDHFGLLCRLVYGTGRSSGADPQI